MNKAAPDKAFPDANALFGQAEALFKQEYYEEALACYERAIEQGPFDARFHVGKGASLGYLGRYEEALAACEQALWLNPNSGWIWSHFLGPPATGEKALLAAERGIKQAPTDPQPHRDKGRTLNYLRRYDEAVAAYQQALELAPDNLSITFELGNLLIHLKRPLEALVVYEQMCVRQPKRATAHASRAWALLSLERYDEGLTACERALELDSHLAFAWKHKCEILARLQRAEESAAARQRVNELDPTALLEQPDQGQELLAPKLYDQRLIAASFAYHARLLRMVHRYAEALETIEYALERDPNTPSHYGEKSLNLEYLQRYEEALAALEEAIRLDPTYVHSTLVQRWPKFSQGPNAYDAPGNDAYQEFPA